MKGTPKNQKIQKKKEKKLNKSKNLKVKINFKNPKKKRESSIRKKKSKKKSPPSADLRYGEADSVSHSTHIFATRKG